LCCLDNQNIFYIAHDLYYFNRFLYTYSTWCKKSMKIKYISLNLSRMFLGNTTKLVHCKYLLGTVRASSRNSIPQTVPVYNTRRMYSYNSRSLPPLSGLESERVLRRSAVAIVYICRLSAGLWWGWELRPSSSFFRPVASCGSRNLRVLIVPYRRAVARYRTNASAHFSVLSRIG